MKISLPVRKKCDISIAKQSVEGAKQRGDEERY